MTDRCGLLLAAVVGTALGAFADIAPAQASSTVRNASSAETPPSHRNHDDPATHPHLGMWVTQDGQIRHELLPNGRYDEQRGSRKSAYQGRYWVRGDRISYLDDTGFTADGIFRDGKFFHGGYIFFRER